MLHQPLVSLVVLCFNGSRTVIDTLNSIKGQLNIDLKKVEIWISDDCSNDNSVDVINAWINANKDFFFDVNFLINERNLGINKTINILWSSCRAEWIKSIAADDILKSNCLSDNLKYVKSHKKSDVVISKMARFKNDISNIIDVKPNPNQCEILKDIRGNQINDFLKRPFNVAPSAFIRKSVLSKINYAPECYLNFEDLPVWIRLFKLDVKFDYLDLITVYYRLGDSVSNSENKMFNYNMSKVLLKFYREEIKELVSGVELLFYYENIIDFKIRLIICERFSNRNNAINKLIYKASYLLRPLSLYRIIRAK